MCACNTCVFLLLVLAGVVLESRKTPLSLSPVCFVVDVADPRALSLTLKSLYTNLMVMTRPHNFTYNDMRDRYYYYY